MALSDQEINSRYLSHQGDDQTNAQARVIRAKFIDMAKFIDDVLPDGRLKALAHTNLETAAMFAIKTLYEGSPVVLDYEEDFDYGAQLDERPGPTAIHLAP